MPQYIKIQLTVLFHELFQVDSSDCGLVYPQLLSASSWIYWHNLLPTSAVVGTGKYMMTKLDRRVS